MRYTQGYYTARISLDAKIARHLTGQVFYQLVRSHYYQASAAVNDDQTGVQLTLSF